MFLDDLGEDEFRKKSSPWSTFPWDSQHSHPRVMASFLLLDLRKPFQFFGGCRFLKCEKSPGAIYYQGEDWVWEKVTFLCFRIKCHVLRKIQNLHIFCGQRPRGLLWGLCPHSATPKQELIRFEYLWKSSEYTLANWEYSRILGQVLSSPPPRYSRGWFVVLWASFYEKRSY